MTYESRIHAVVGDLYDAAVNEAGWKGLAPKIAALFGGESCCIFQTSQAPGAELLTLTDNYTPQYWRDYAEYGYQLDEWAKWGKQSALNRAAVGQEVMSRSEFLNSAFFSDWCRPVGIFDLVGAAISVERTTTAVVGIHHPFAAFDESHKRTLQMLIPHFRQALRVRTELSRQRLERDVALAALDHTGAAAFVVAGDARVIYTNKAGSALLTQSDGLLAAAGVLSSSTSQITGQLHFLIAGAARTASGKTIDGGGTLKLPRRAGPPLLAFVSPLRSETAHCNGHPGLALVLVRDPAAQTWSSSALRELYDLTPAESLLACALVEGKRLSTYAAERQVSLNTVRTHLKRLMQKTGTRRQSELVSLVMRSTATP